MRGSGVFSSESVGEGHPDKVCDAVSDGVLDRCLELDGGSRVACEVLVKGNLVVVGGEVRCDGGRVDVEGVVRDVVRGVGYVDGNWGSFDADGLFVLRALSDQSDDIAAGVDGRGNGEVGAGDQGLMFGFACDETEELMPAPIVFAHRLVRELARARRGGVVNWLGPDCKAQVSVGYVDGAPRGFERVVVSTQHREGVGLREVRDFVVGEVVERVLPRDWLPRGRDGVLVNPTGVFVRGGPDADCGLTGRKVVVDSYGGMGRHGGGAFSGKDATKVDRSGAYMARYVAKNVVAAGLARRCEVQVAYAIGCVDPVSVLVDCFGTGRVSDEVIGRAVGEVFCFRPGSIIEVLGLRRPIFSRTSCYGHFGRVEDLDVFTWERTDRVEDLRGAVG